MNLLEILDSPKSYSELLSVIGDQSALDITLSIHRKQGKIKLNEHGKWEIPKPPSMIEEPLRPTLPPRVNKETVRLVPRVPYLMCRMCEIAKPPIEFPREEWRKARHRCARCKYRSTTGYKRLKALGLTRRME